MTKPFVSVLAGCGQFTTKVNKEHLAAVMKRREVLRLNSARGAPRVALHSRLDAGSKSEAELLAAMQEARK